jgi:hypothetical protein
VNAHGVNLHAVTTCHGPKTVGSLAGPSSSPHPRELAVLALGHFADFKRPRHHAQGIDPSSAGNKAVTYGSNLERRCKNFRPPRETLGAEGAKA